jgi:hypothetical protein
LLLNPPTPGSSCQNEEKGLTPLLDGNPDACRPTE